MAQEATVPQVDLASAMEVLASEVRVRLLHRLGSPAFVPDLAKEFALTRQAIQKHLDALESAGLVLGTPSRRGALRAREYRAHPAGLFAFKESVLAIAVQMDPGALPPAPTLPAPMHESARGGSGTGLLLVHGDQQGRWFSLAARGSSVLGRDARVEVSLAYDPFASQRHAMLRHSPTGWTATDLRSTNGTRVNFRLLGSGETVPLRNGDLLTVGKSHLLFRDGS